MAPATASAASLINVATMAGPRTNEEKFIDIRWLSPADQPVRWLVGASMFEYESLSAQWFGYAGYLLGLADHCCQTGPGDIAGFVLNKLHNSLGNTNIPILMPARK